MTVTTLFRDSWIERLELYPQALLMNVSHKLSFIEENAWSVSRREGCENIIAAKYEQSSHKVKIIDSMLQLME